MNHSLGHPTDTVLLLDLLAQTKPKLDDGRAEIRSSLIDDLHHVAFLAEGLTEQRARSAKKNWPFADILDREGNLFMFREVKPAGLILVSPAGVLLWNTSGLIYKASDDNVRPVVAARRCLFPKTFCSDGAYPPLIPVLKKKSEARCIPTYGGWVRT